LIKKLERHFWVGAKVALVLIELLLKVRRPPRSGGEPEAAQQPTGEEA